MLTKRKERDKAYWKLCYCNYQHKNDGGPIDIIELWHITHQNEVDNTWQTDRARTIWVSSLIPFFGAGFQ